MVVDICIPATWEEAVGGLRSKTKKPYLKQTKAKKTFEGK
jgi:hypothetical protein